MAKRDLNILIVAGEASGDAHAAKLVRAFRELRPQAHFFGAAGPKMRVAGVEAVVKADELSVVGVAEIGRALPMFLGALRRLNRAATQREPAIAILVDFPDFNLKLARSLKKKGIPVVYYISPQLWAWRQYRIKTIKKYVDLLITILPFEKGWYATRGVTNVEYVGNPLAREVFATVTREAFFTDHHLDQSRPLVALLPGSRDREISRILPDLLAAAALMPETQFVVAANREIGERHRLPPNVICVRDQTYNALAASDAAVVTSGTATLEAGILGTPMVIVYKTSKLNYALLEPMIEVPHYGLVNLIAGRRVAQELIQRDLTPDRVKGELIKLLEPEMNQRKRAELKAAADMLGQGGASRRAAEAIVKLVQP